MNESLRQKKNIAIIALMVIIVLAGLIAGLVTPDCEYSLSERRKLAQRPSVSLKSWLSASFMKDFEDYSLDQFPSREALRTGSARLKLEGLGLKDIDGLYVSGGHISKLEYPLNEASLSRMGKYMNAVLSEYTDGNNSRVYSCLVPDKNKYLAGSSGRPSMDYARLQAYFSSVSSDIKNIDISELLSLEDYYFTDPHWKQENLGDIAGRLLEEMGAGGIATFTPKATDSVFTGVYAGQLGYCPKEDQITLMESPGLEKAAVIDLENNKSIPVYDMEAITGRDPYEAYLGGSISLLRIENPASENKRRLIMFRDSFGSSLAPLFIPSYSEITLIDTRYISYKALGNYVDFSDADILFLYSSYTVNNSNSLK